MSTNGVNDFGQAEDLSERLRGLLKAYHGDLDLVTELLQNSDDAGATKLHLVLDVTDTHANAFVPRDPFAKEWKELHGPALLAWNDRTFSPEDMVGIQRLGTGSKRDALMKKGRFGVGANIMYMVTDCPAFISDDETLNIFDPCRYFTEKAKNSPKPGAQLERNAMVQHGDVYQKFCIDKNHPLRGATAFRLALPLPGTRPRIAEQPMTVGKIREFFEKVFADEGQCLLFLQSVRELKLLEKRADGSVVELVSFAVQLSSEDNFKLSKFFEKCTEFEKIRKSWKEGQPEPTNSCPPSSISYQVDLIVSKGGGIPTRSKWLICQQVGYSKPCSAADAALIQQCGSIKLLPLAGLATRIDRVPVHGSVFSGLPLQLDSNIGIHVNGHFALDNEGRKTLFTSRNPNSKESTWNRQLFTRVLPQAYVDLLLAAKGFLFPSSLLSAVKDFLFPPQNATTTIKDLASYYALFPHPSRLADSWKLLGEDVLKIIVEKGHQLLVSLHKTSGSNAVSLRWFNVPITTAADHCFMQLDFGILKNYFEMTAENFRSKHKGLSVEIILLDLDANLLFCPKELTAEFSSKATVSKLTAEFARKFLISVSKSWLLPQAIQTTPLRSIDIVEAVASYCLKRAGGISEFRNSVEGLPLLLTADSVLHRFQVNSSIYAESEYYELFQDSEFLHHRLVNSFSCTLIEAGLLKKAVLVDIKLLLESKSTLQHFINRLRSGVAESCDTPEKSSYVCRLWKFLLSNDQFSPTSLQQAFGSWNLVPVLAAGTDVKQLIPVSTFPHVLHAASATLTGDESFFSKFLPRLDRQLLQTASYKGVAIFGSWLSPQFDALCCRAANTSLLPALVQVLLQRWHAVTAEDREYLLGYFVRNHSIFDVATMKSLPIYPTISGCFVAISGSQKVYWLSANSTVHSNGLGIISGSSGIFLRLLVQQGCEAFYKKLGAQELSYYRLYEDFVMPGFASLCQKDQVRHLQFLMDNFWQNIGSAAEWTKLKAKLQNSAFIKLDSGGFVKAADLYDDSLDSFRRFLSGKFLPTSFREALINFSSTQLQQWFRFLCDLGMESELRIEDVKMIAEQLEADGKAAGVLPLAEVQKFTDVIYKGSHARQNFSAIRDAKIFPPESIVSIIPETQLLLHEIPSLAAASKVASLCSIADGCSSEFAAVSWSVQPILPSWAILASERNAQKPSLQTVLQHAKNFFNDVRDAKQPQLKAVISEISLAIYGFICKAKNQRNDSEIASALKDVPVVFLSDPKSWSLVEASLTCFDDEDEDWAPFYRKLPTAYEAYLPLFRLLGATSTRSLAQCCQVLLKVKQQSDDKPITDPKLKLLVRNVCKYLMENYATTKTTTKWSEVSVLWLPNDQFQMTESGRLIYLDRNTRIFCPGLMATDAGLKGSWLYEFDFDHAGRFGYFLSNLPNEAKHLQPRASSKVLHEAVANTEIKCGTRDDGQCDIVRNLTAAFKINTLSDALVRLVKNTRGEYLTPVSPEMLEQVRVLLSNCTVVCVDNLKTCWKQDGTANTSTPIDVNAFIKANDDGKTFIVYVKHNADEVKKLSFYLDLSTRLSPHLCSVSPIHLCVVLQFAIENAGNSDCMEQVLRIAEHASHYKPIDVSTEKGTRQEKAAALFEEVTKSVSVAASFSSLSFGGYGGFSSSSEESVSPIYKPPKAPKSTRLSEAKELVKQGMSWKVNAENAFKAHPKVGNDAVLFLCHQSAEFLVKAVAFYENDEKQNHHRIDSIARGTQALVCKLLRYGCDYIQTRYPDSHHPVTAPCQVYKDRNNDVTAALAVLEEICEQLRLDYSELF